MKTEYLLFFAKVCSLQMGSKLLYIFEGLQMVQLLLGMLDQICFFFVPESKNRAYLFIDGKQVVIQGVPNRRLGCLRAKGCATTQFGSTSVVHYGCVYVSIYSRYTQYPMIHYGHPGHYQYHNRHTASNSFTFKKNYY